MTESGMHFAPKAKHSSKKSVVVHVEWVFYDDTASDLARMEAPLREWYPESLVELGFRGNNHGTHAGSLSSRSRSTEARRIPDRELALACERRP